MLLVLRLLIRTAEIHVSIADGAAASMWALNIAFGKAKRLAKNPITPPLTVSRARDVIHNSVFRLTRKISASRGRINVIAIHVYAEGTSLSQYRWISPRNGMMTVNAKASRN